MKRLMQNLLLLFLSCIFIFIVLEIGVRLFAPQYKKTFIFHETLGMIRIPDSSFVYFRQDDGKKIKHQVNSDGFVSRDLIADKPADTFRVVILGDSYTEALQVEDDQRFSSLLEEKLNKISSKKIEIINLGFSGFSTAQEFLALKKFGLKYKPDLIILNFLANNDIFDNSSDIAYVPGKPFFKIVDNGLIQVHKPQPFFKNFFLNLISDYFVLPRFFYNKYQELKTKIIYSSINKIIKANDSVYDKQYSVRWDDAWLITQHLIEEIDKLAKENQSKFLVVSITSNVQISDKLKEEFIQVYKNFNKEVDFSKPDAILSQFLSEKGIDFLSFWEPFSQYPDKENLYFNKDGHYSYVGHQLAADLISQYLIDKSLIPLK